MMTLLSIALCFPPDISGSCQFGKVDQNFDRVSIIGSGWTATGTVDRKLLRVVWINKSDGRPAYGIYRVEGDRVNGVWGWADECELTVDGDDICGELHAETLYLTRSP